MSFKDWCKNNLNLTPISSSIERGLKEHKDRVARARAEVERKRAERASRPEPQDPDEALFASMKERKRQEDIEAARYAKQETIRALARQILVQREAQSSIRLSETEADAALAAASRIYALTADFFIMKGKS